MAFRSQYVFRNPLMDTAADAAERRKLDRYFTIAIPALSFGGIGIAYLLEKAGVIPEAGTFVWGCIAASFLLGYFAYLKPKRDIVALCAPIYGIVIFLIPVEYTPSLLLQVLFAASITILLVRLNRRFGSLADIQGGDTPMHRFLREYIERIRPDFPGIPKKTAHEIASAFLSFKFGLFPNTIDECRLALSSLPEGKSTAALKKALQIVLANAQNLENSQVTADEGVAFSGDEKAFVAVTIPDEKNEDPASLALDNALVLLYAVAIITSPDDEEPLEEHQNYVLKILTSYKSALGMA